LRPLRTESFELGMAAGPDYIAADSGSDDVGPVPLGSDTLTIPVAWQRHDLEQTLLASREQRVSFSVLSFWRECMRHLAQGSRSRFGCRRQAGRRAGKELAAGAQVDPTTR
jgi:hypothetical protein